jgi:hypothetical protein
MEKPLCVRGIAIATQVLHRVGMNDHGTMRRRKRLDRAQMTCLAPWLPTLMGLAACSGAQSWARRLREGNTGMRSA